MDLIVDANILFAALIKESHSFNLLFSNKFRFFTPEYIFLEFEKHKDEILRKSKRSPEELSGIVDILKKRIILIPLEELFKYVEKAERLTPDPDDMAYFAAALKMNCGIWTNDKKLKKQDEIRIYSTREVTNIIGE